jgi:protein required for attachment to host cells
MNRTFVAVMDGTKARFFTLQYPDFPEYESGPDLVEHECLKNSTKELQGKQLWSNTKTGSNHGSGTKGHNYDDHRENHILEFERNFAKEIVNSLISLIQEYESNHLILVAEPQILGIVREVLNTQASKNLLIEELAKDLCKYKTGKIQEYLASKQLIPQRKFVNLR